MVKRVFSSSQLQKGETVSETSAGVGGYAGMLRIEIELLFKQITQRNRFLGHDPFIATVRLGPTKSVDNGRFDRRTAFAEELAGGVGYFRPTGQAESGDDATGDLNQSEIIRMRKSVHGQTINYQIA